MPIDVAKGVVTLDFEDVVIPGVMPLAWKRHYSTALLEQPQTALGRGWTSQFFSTLTWVDGDYRFVTPDGETEVVPDSERIVWSGGVIRHFGAFLEIFRRGSGHIVQTWNAESHQVVRYCFETGEEGVAWRLSSIEDSAGGTLELDRDPDGRLDRIRQPSERRALLFTYDNAGLIDRVVLHSVGQHIALARYEYSAAADHIAAFDAAGHGDRFEYDPAGRIVREVNKDGGVFKYRYDGRGRCVLRSGLDRYNEKRLRYIDAARTTEVADSYDEVFIYQYLPSGQVVTEIDPLGGRRTTEYDEHGRAVTSTDATGSVTRYEFDDAGNRVAITNAEGAVTRFAFDESHRVVSMTDARGGEWQRRYDEHGHLVATVDPLGHNWAFVFNADGQPTEIVNPKGLRKRQQFRDGVLDTITDWLGNVTEFTFDALGRVVERRGALGEVLRFGYDPMNHPTRVDLPDGTMIAATYDAAGNMTRYVDGKGQTTAWRFGPCGRPLEREDPLGGRVRYVWGSERGRLDALINEKGETYRFERDAAGRVVRDTAFDGAERSYRYDAEGHAVEYLTANGERIRIERDRLHRVIARRAGNGDEMRYAFDPLGDLVSAWTHGTSVTFERDPYGRVLLESQDDRWVATTYDALGNVVKTESSLGAHIWSEVDGNGHLIRVSTSAEHSVDFDRNAYGEETKRRTPGCLMEQTFDPMGRLIEQRIAGPGDLQLDGRSGHGSHTIERVFSYDAAGQLMVVEDALMGRVEYDYDPAARLLSAVRNRGVAETFSYDETGNMASLRRSDERGERRFEYEPGSRLIRQGSTRFEYDAEGRLTARVDRDGEPTADKWRYEWDPFDRLKSVIRPDGEAWHYEYDALGRRVSKRCSSRSDSVETFVWNADVVLHHLSENGSIRSWVFQPHSFSPVLQLQDGRAFSIVCDQIGSPSELLDEWGRIVWSRAASAWGVSGDRQTPPTIECPFAFPGQWRDVESGLHYNLHRYYDPTSGRFISQDPLGLRTGPNLYSYAPNPTTWIDPLGLCDNEEDHFVYRVLRDDEDPAHGLVAKNPNATYTPEGHVIHGSKPGFQSQYISTSKTLAAAQANRDRYGSANQRIVKIDTRQVGSRTDLTGPNSPLRGNTAKNRAGKSQEVLITGPVPPSAISPAE